MTVFVFFHPSWGLLFKKDYIDMTKNIELSKLDRGTNIREEVDAELHELSESIRKNGLLNPLTVVQKGSRYEVIAGHRRLKALQMLGEPFVECNVLDYEPSKKEVLCIQLQENCCRKNMSAWEYVDLFNKLKKEGLTVRDISKLCGRTEHWVYEQYLAEQMLVANGDTTKKDRTLTVAGVKKKYGYLGRVKDKKYEIETVRFSKQKNSYSVYIKNKQAETEFLLFMERFKAKWQNSKTSE